MNKHNHDKTNSQREKIKEIFNKLPDEKINRDTTGRSNAQLMYLIGENSTSFDRVPEPILHTFDYKKKKSDINQAEKSEINSNLSQSQNNQLNFTNPPTNQQLTEENMSPELILIANDILVSTIDSVNSVFFISITCLLYFEVGFPVWILLIVFFIIGLIHFIRSIGYYYALNKEENDHKFKLLSEIFDELLLLIIIITFYLYLEYEWFSLLYIALPLPLLDLCVWYVLNYKETKSYIYTSSTIRIFLFIQFLHIALKIDNLIFWEWKMIFWSSWLVFVLIGLYVIGIMLLILYSTFQNVSGRRNNFQVYGLIWCLNVLLILDVNIFLISLGFVDYFTNNDSLNLKINFLIMTIWLPFFELMTFYFSKPLICFIVSINEEPGTIQEFRDIENIDSLQFPHQPENKSKAKSLNVLIERKTQIPKNIPQFLVKFSASYFQVADFKKEVIFGILKHKFKSKTSQKLTIKNNQIQKKTPRKTNDIPQIGGFNNIELKELQNKTSEFKKAHNDDEKKNKNFVDINERITPSGSQIIKTESDKSIRNCIICYDKSPDAVLMDCGHGGICYDCAVNLWKKSDGECHLCRNKISKILQIELNAKSKVLMPVLAVIEKKDDV